MQTKSLIAAAALALVAGASFADTLPADRPLTRAEVQQSVLQARASGELRPAGEAGDDPFVPLNARSNVTRADVERQVAAARAAGQLTPAGQGYDVTVATLGTASQTTRAALRAEVLQARADGTLAPAGQASGDEGEHYAHATPEHASHFASLFHIGH